MAKADPAAHAWYAGGYYGQGYGYGGYYGSTTKSPWSGLYGGNGMNYGRKKREADPAVLATTAVELTALDAITPTVMPTIIPSTVIGGKISEDIYNLTPSSKMPNKINNSKCFNQE